MSTRALTVLHVAANRWWTGSAEPIVHLATGLRDRGHRVLLALIRGDRFEAKAREAGLSPLPGLDLRPRGQPLSAARDVARLRALARREAVDVIHAHHSHDHWLGVLARARGAHGMTIPVVRTFHNARSVRQGPAATWLHRRTAAVFAVSRAIEARCGEVGIPRARVFWTPGTVDLARFRPDVDPAPIREEFKLGQAPVVVSVARFAANRGHDLLLAGFRALQAGLPEARLLLVGKGERRAHLEQVVAELELTSRVLFTGYRDADLPAVLAAADCFALMAAGSDESCRAALEAMAAGKPVIARRVGALPETVAHGVTGFLLDDDAPVAVARALATVLGDRERARVIGAAARRRAETEFDPARTVDTVEAVYRQLVAPRA
jgi:glycosyltransferase involved in cell wall biosynthesis